MELVQKKSPSAFATLTQFMKVVNETEVRDEVGNLITLEEGLEKTVNVFQELKKGKKKIILIGNGGSESIASHLSIDLNKNAGIRALAFTDSSLLTCLSNDYGFDEVYSKAIEYHLDENDLLIAISSSGKSQNILKAVQKTKKMFGNVITFSGFGADNPLKEMGLLNFYLPSPRYGVVEVGHSLLLHAIIDEAIERAQIWS